MGKKPLETTPAEEDKVLNEWVKPNKLKYCIFCKIWNKGSRDTCRICDGNLISYVPAILLALFAASESFGLTTVIQSASTEAIY